MHLCDVITCLVMRVLWMVTILLYINIKDVVDGTDGTQNRQTSIQRGKGIHLCIVHKIRYSAFCKVAYCPHYDYVTKGVKRIVPPFTHRIVFYALHNFYRLTTLLADYIVEL